MSGLCTKCRERSPRPGRKTCQICADKHSSYMRQWYKDHAPRVRKRMKGYRENNVERIHSYGKKYRDAVKTEVFNHYGWVCACCGETEPKFLSIDHVKGGGTQHRKKIGRGNAFYLWLKNNGFPKDFQTLCFNCNCAKGFYGRCPHEERKLHAVG